MRVLVALSVSISTLELPLVAASMVPQILPELSHAVANTNTMWPRSYQVPAGKSPEDLPTENGEFMCLLEALERGGAATRLVRVDPEAQPYLGVVHEFRREDDSELLQEHKVIPATQGRFCHEAVQSLIWLATVYSKWPHDGEAKMQLARTALAQTQTSATLVELLEACNYLGVTEELKAHALLTTALHASITWHNASEVLDALLPAEATDSTVARDIISDVLSSASMRWETLRLDATLLVSPDSLEFEERVLFLQALFGGAGPGIVRLLGSVGGKPISRELLSLYETLLSRLVTTGVTVTRLVLSDLMMGSVLFQRVKDLQPERLELDAVSFDLESGIQTFAEWAQRALLMELHFKHYNYPSP
ncbi:MAG: hypothetical protein MHM6MM_008203, partial [Cercozoa sp. M6MM]